MLKLIILYCVIEECIRIFFYNLIKKFSFGKQNKCLLKQGDTGTFIILNTEKVKHILYNYKVTDSTQETISFTYTAFSKNGKIQYTTTGEFCGIFNLNTTEVIFY